MLCIIAGDEERVHTHTPHAHTYTQPSQLISTLPSQVKEGGIASNGKLHFCLSIFTSCIFFVSPSLSRAYIAVRFIALVSPRATLSRAALHLLSFTQVKCSFFLNNAHITIHHKTETCCARVCPCVIVVLLRSYTLVASVISRPEPATVCGHCIHCLQSTKTFENIKMYPYTHSLNLNPLHTHTLLHICQEYTPPDVNEAGKRHIENIFNYDVFLISVLLVLFYPKTW